MEPGIRGREKKSTKNNFGNCKKQYYFLLIFLESHGCPDKHHVTKKSTKNNIVTTITQVAFKFWESADDVCVVSMEQGTLQHVLLVVADFVVEGVFLLVIRCIFSRLRLTWMFMTQSFSKSLPSTFPSST